MPTFTITSFRIGKETRRAELTSQPGALVTCENAHINEGGEIEKRFAFKLLSDVGILDNSGNQGTFGLEVSSAGLVIFGSANPFGGAAPYLASAIPTTSPTVTYKQLVHPEVTAGETYQAAKHRMTALLTSTCYGGLTWAIALFSDGFAFGYYDGTAIAEFKEGRVTSLMVDTDVKANISAAITRLFPDYTVASPVGDPSALQVTAAGADPYFAMDVSCVSSSGNITQRLVSGGIVGVAATGAYAMITLSGTVTANSDISSVSAPDGDGNFFNLLGATVVCEPTGSVPLSVTAQLLADEINRNAGLSDVKYSAIADGEDISVYAPASLGDSVNHINITVTYDNTNGLSINGSAGTGKLAVNVDKTTVTGSRSSPSWVTVTSEVVTGEATGGTGPYTYEWQINDNGTWRACASSDPIYPLSGTAASTKFAGLLPKQFSMSGIFRLVVTDSIPNTEESTAVTVILENQR